MEKREKGLWDDVQQMLLFSFCGSVEGQFLVRHHFLLFIICLYFFIQNKKLIFYMTLIGMYFLGGLEFFWMISE